jgi:hypothetical protein
VRFLAVFRTNNGTGDQGVCNSDPESELFQMGALMRGDDQAVFNDNFPDPAEQAEGLSLAKVMFARHRPLPPQISNTPSTKRINSTGRE